jgi:hypothetical protein
MRKKKSTGIYDTDYYTCCIGLTISFGRHCDSLIVEE